MKTLKPYLVVVFMILLAHIPKLYAIPGGGDVFRNQICPALLERALKKEKITKKEMEELSARPQMERFEIPWDKLVELLNAADKSGENFPEFLVKNGARNRAFDLETLLRAYSKSDVFNKKNRELIEEVRVEIKELEDELGIYGDYAGQVRDAEEEIKLPKARLLRTLGWLGLQENNAKREFSMYLNNSGWLDPKSKTRKRFEKAVLEILRLKPKIDREAYLRALVDQIQGTYKKFKNGGFDPEDLEGGIHESRRQLRWIALYIQAAKGLVVPLNTPSPIPEFTDVKLRPGLEKFVTIPDTDNVKHCYICRDLYLEITNLIDELGRVKDYGQKYNFLVETFLGSNVAQSWPEAEQMALSTMEAKYGKMDITAEFLKIQELINKTKLLKELRKEVERGI